MFQWKNEKIRFHPWVIICLLHVLWFQQGSHLDHMEDPYLQRQILTLVMTEKKI